MKIQKNYIASSRKSGAGAIHQYENLLEQLNSNENLRGFAVITFKNAAEFGLASNSAVCLRNEIVVQNGVVSTNTAMRSLLVIMFQPYAKDVVKLPAAKTDKVIQTFAFRGSNKTFAERIGHRSPRWNLNRPHVSLFPEHVEGIRILSITIPDQELRLDTFVFHPHRGVPRLLHYPLGIRMIGARTAIDFSATQMDEHEHIGMAYPTEREYSFREKIARHDAINMSMNKGRPGNRRSLSSLLRVGKMALPSKDVPNGGCSDTDTQLFELPKDATVSPTKIFPRESHDENTRGKGCTRSARRLVGTPSTQLSQPLSVRFRYDDMHQFANVVVHRRTQPKQLGPFSGSGDDSARIHPSAEHTDLRLKKLQPRVVSRPHPLRREHHQRKKYGIHPASFRFANVAKRPKNTGYGAVDIFPNHQVIPGLRQIPYTSSHRANVSTAFVDTKIAAYSQNGNLVAAGSAA